MNIENLNNWNPWWTTKEVPVVFRGVPRRINPLMFKALSEREILALTGIRRGGKTTLMYQMIVFLLKTCRPSQILYVNLDDEALKKETLESIYTLYRQHKNPDAHAFIFLDEIQNITQWERFLKKYYDLREKVKFIVSGSSAHLLRGEYATLLTGRNITFTVFPLTYKEFLEFGGIDVHEMTTVIRRKLIHELYAYLEYGGFPEVYFKEKEVKSLLLKQYLDDIIYKDIVKIHNLNAKKITDLAVYLLTNIANPYTIRKIRNFTGLSFDSIKDYISYLEDAYLISPLDHFSYSFKETVQSPKKSYTLDCGLRNIVGLRFSHDVGRLAENCVRAALQGQGENVFYWKGKGEVDFVVKHANNSLTGINVSFTDKILEREIRGMMEFKARFKRTKELLLLTHDTEERRGEVLLIPLWKWLLKGG